MKEFMNLKGDAYFQQELYDICFKTMKSKDDIEFRHAMVITGFVMEVESIPEHFILLNSLGPHWGDNGFFRLVKSDKSHRPYNYITQIYATIKELIFQKESDGYFKHIPLNPKGIYVVSQDKGTSKASENFLTKLGKIGKTRKFK